VIATHDAATIPDAVPPFLGDCHPALIAEREDDHVVIEVKPARALKGSNDLVKLAERVAAEPGWRLELVALKSEDNDTSLLSPGWLDRMLQRVAVGENDVLASTYLAEVLTYLLRGLALRNKLRLRDKSAASAAYELAFAGVIDNDVLHKITDVFDWQESIMHEQPTSHAAADQIATMLSLCRELHAQAQDPAC
jgi:hypothetical protein